MRLRRSSALLRDSSEMNAEGAQEKNKWNDVELCGTMRNYAERADHRRYPGGHRLGGTWGCFNRPVVLRAVNIGDF